MFKKLWWLETYPAGINFKKKWSESCPSFGNEIMANGSCPLLLQVQKPLLEGNQIVPTTFVCGSFKS